MGSPPEQSSPRWPKPTWILGWAAAWLIPFAVWQLLLIPAGFGMFGRSWPSGLFFLAAASAGLWLHRAELRAWGEPVGARPVAALLGLGVLLGVGCVAAHAAYPLEAADLVRFEELQIGIVRLDLTYFAVKLPELIFQQAMIYVLVKHLSGRGFSGWGLVGSFALIFGGIHLPIIGFKGLAGVPFVLAATGASLVFPPLIDRLRGGVAYSFGVHTIAYLIAGVALRASQQG